MSDTTGDATALAPTAAGRAPWVPTWAVTLSRVEALTVAVASLMAVGAVIARRPSSVVHPQLWAEDGAVWVHDAYTRGWWRPLLQPHTGYLQDFPRLVSDIGLLLPLSWLPALFVIASIVVQVLPVTLFVSARFERLVPGRPARLLIAGLYLALPNSFEVDANLTNAQWHLALLAFLCVVAAPAGLGWRVFDVAILLLSGLTGPFVIVLALLGLVWCWSRRAAPDRAWTLSLWGISVLLAGVQAVALLTSKRAEYPLGASFHRLVDVIGGQVAVAGLLGSAGMRHVEAGAHPFAVFLVASAALALVYAAVLLRGPLVLRLFVLMAVAIVISALATPMASSNVPQWVALTTPGTGSRYWVIPILAFYLSLLWMAAWPLRRAGRPGPRSRPSRALGLPAAAVGALALLTSVVFAMPRDWSYPRYVDTGYQAAVARFDRLPRGTRAAIPINPPGWAMVLVKK